MTNAYDSEMGKVDIVFNPVLYTQLLAPFGVLPRDISCHALWHYYITGMLNWEDERDPIVIVGTKDPTYNYKQLFTSIATMYGVQPENMIPFWGVVDTQARLLNLPVMPNADRYRFNKTPEIKTQ